MSDILDDLRAELDSAFERAENARVGRRRLRALTLLVPVAAAALAVAVHAPTRDGIPPDERAVPASPVNADEYGPVSANVLGREDQRMQLDKGLEEDIHHGDPVIDGAGLVGTVVESVRGSSVVTLITDQSFATSVYAGHAEHPGSITAAIGSPGELLFEPVDATAAVRVHDLVLTAGTTDPAFRSRYPRALPIGRVTRIELGNGDLDRRIYVAPAAALDRLVSVRVLTAPG